jgi:hypothetical protein
VLRCQRLLESLGVDWTQAHVVVEGQFYVDHTVSKRRGYQSSPWTDVERLIECRVAWQSAAALLGASTSTAAPGTWIPQTTKGAPGATSKERIQLVVRRWLLGVPLAGDEHDAALMGCWYVRSIGGRVVVAGGEEEARP